jgi:hypothetical protein
MKALSILTRAAAVVLLCSPALFVGCGSDDAVSSKGSWHWSALGDGVPDDVWDLQEYDGKIYAAGEFAVHYDVRVYIGGQWVQFGDPMYSNVGQMVYGLTTYNDRLIVTGSFDSAGHAVSNSIAAWDGSSWSALGSGLPQGMTGYRMAAYNGLLIVGNQEWMGTFRLMAWNGSSWSAIKSGGVGHVADMCVYDGELVVVGDSMVDRGAYIDNVYWVRSWDGSSWMSLSGWSGSPSSLAVMDDTLYLGGADIPYLQAWTGSAWESRSTAAFATPDVDGTINCMVSHNGKLVVAGDFNFIDGDTCNNIATWNRTSFAPITTGLTGGTYGWVRALECFGERLIVAGDFDHAGSVEANNVAEWSNK